MKNRFLFVFGALWVALMSYKMLNPAASDGKVFFQHLTTQKIQCIELSPLDSNSPIRRFVTIKNTDELNIFIKSWTGINTFIANHPKDIWSMTVMFHTDRGTYSGVLRATTNQGMMFDFNRSPTGWPVNSEYQLVKSRPEIEAMLQSLKGSATCSAEATSFIASSHPTSSIPTE